MMFKVLHKAYGESAQSLYTTSRIGILRFFFKIKKTRFCVCQKHRKRYKVYQIARTLLTLCALKQMHIHTTLYKIVD